MSGGVDSSAAAAILVGQGRRLIGVTMKVWDAPADTVSREGACCSLDDANDARAVAVKLGFPHYTINATEEFKTKVVDYFVGEYMTGRTPNPCVLCNQEVKFDFLFKKGSAFGASMVATGHYARIGEFMGAKTILKGGDAEKDQSYFLFSINPSRLDKIIFPLGELTKTESRAIAEKYGLPVASKRESQEICFIPDDDYARFIKERPEAVNVHAGDIVDEKGDVLGRHKGFPFYTVGQRRGLGIGHSERLYVTAVEPSVNRVVVGGAESVHGKVLKAGRMNWFIAPDEAVKLELTAKIRSRSKEAPAHVHLTEEGRAVIEFANPQLAITPGQAVVLYHGEVVIGGGWIEARLG
ncbi:MAG: tRNA 2-thiouridine(34) synthase MnmA [Nitrospinae bacterium]|nr:tRNA 2-thiouridine(34) synthase MnmA [Nitrospinota bacterium]